MARKKKKEKKRTMAENLASAKAPTKPKSMQVVTCKCATQIAYSKRRDERKRCCGGVMKSSKRVEVRTLSVHDVQGRDARCRGRVEREGMLASVNESRTFRPAHAGRLCSKDQGGVGVWPMSG